MVWLKNKFEKIMNWFGYYSELPVDIQTLTTEYYMRLSEIDGLNLSVGYLERLRNEINGVLTAVILLSGQEEMKLENGVLASVFEKQLETIFTSNPDNSLTCKVQIKPTLEDFDDLEETDANTQ